jgi:hypothetical protein
MLTNNPTRSRRHRCSLSDKNASGPKTDMFLWLDLNKFQFSIRSLALGANQPDFEIEGAIAAGRTRSLTTSHAAA